MSLYMYIYIYIFHIHVVSVQLYVEPGNDLNLLFFQSFLALSV